MAWSGLPDHENLWMRISDLKHQFPSFSLEGKLNFDNGGIDRPLRAYYKGANKKKQVTQREGA